MSQMTHEEMVELIREVVQEEKKSVSFLQKMKDMASLVVPITVILGFFNLVFLKASVEPTIDARMKQHNVEAREAMDEVGTRFVTQAEFQAYTSETKQYISEKNEKWRQQEAFNARIEVGLLEIQKDIKELLRRK